MDKEVKNKIKNGIQQKLKQTALPTKPFLLTLAETLYSINELDFNRKYKSWEATEYPKVCTVLGIKLDWDMNGCNNNSPSLDRVNPKLGYIKGNVIMMSNLANKMKNNATPEELKQFSEYHLSHQQLDTNPNQIGLF